MALIAETESMMTDTNHIYNIKEKCLMEKTANRHSFHVAANLKKTTDTHERFHIYKVNSVNMNNMIYHMYLSVPG